MHEITREIRSGLRLLRRDRGFAITAILILGFGIGINNMLFTILRAHTMRGLPIDRPDRVLYISSFDQRTPDRGVSFPEFLDLRAATKSFSGLAAFVQTAVGLGDEGRSPDRIEAAYSSANAFSLLGIRPALGRLFAEDDDRDGALPVVVLGHRVWISRYRAAAAILGQTVLINGTPATVIGVMPVRSGFPSTAELWMPLSMLPGLATQTRAARQLRVFGRLRDGAAETDARAEVESIVARLAGEFPDTSRDNQARVVPINQRLLGRLTDPAWLAFMGFGFLALILSSANVANLMLARAVDRTREIAVRASLGATRFRIVRQLLIESSVVAASGGLLGLAVSFGAVRVFESAIPANTLPYWLEYQIDAAVLAALAAVAVATVFIFGVVPAFQAAKADVNRVLRSGGRAIGHTPGARRWTSAFMVLELAITVVMLTFLVADLQSPRDRLASERMLDTDDVLTGTVTLPATSYATPESRRNFYNQLQERIRALPAASSVSVASLLPRRGAVEQTVEVEGRTLPAGEQAPKVATVAIGPHFFQTLALTMERGREFTDWDARLDAATVVVSRRFVDLFLSDRDPIGTRLRIVPGSGTAAGSRWLTIVGVAPQIQHRQEREPVVYLSFGAAPPSTASVLLRTQGDASTIATALRETLRMLDANLPVYRVLTMSQVIQEATWNGRVASRVVRVITTIAFLFCIVGLYAVTARAVAQRTSEIGIRMALGARPPHVAMLILKRAALQVVVGLLAGIAGTFAWESAFGRPNAPAAAAADVLVPLALLLAFATCVACWIPARRAIHVDPAEALRSE